MIFRIAALASPLLLGFVLPFVLALGRGRGWNARKSAGAASTAAAGWILLLAALWTFSGQPVVRLLETACFLLAFGAFLFGLFHFFTGLRIPGQIGCGLVVVLLMGTLFYFNPIVEEARGAAVHSRIAMALEWSPYPVMAYSIFDIDLLHQKWLYTNSAIADRIHGYPDWTRAALWYVLLGFFLHLGYLGLLALKLRFRGR